MAGAIRAMLERAPPIRLFYLPYLLYQLIDAHFAWSASAVKQTFSRGCTSAWKSQVLCDTPGMR